MTRPSLIAGVLGGMGPEATVDLLQRIITGTSVRDDADHVHTLVDNNPQVPSRIDYILHDHGEDPAPELIRMARGLQAQGADFLIMPCNTAHLYAAQIAASVSIPFVNMIDLVVQRVVAARGNRKVGLLASTAVVQTDLYGRAFEGTGSVVIYPDDERQHRLMSLIQNIKAGQKSDADAEVLNDVARYLAGAGATDLVVACTELSAIVDSLDVDVAVIDAAQCLAEETVARAHG